MRNRCGTCSTIAQPSLYLWLQLFNNFCRYSAVAVCNFYCCSTVAAAVQLFLQQPFNRCCFCSNAATAVQLFLRLFNRCCKPVAAAVQPLLQLFTCILDQWLSRAENKENFINNNDLTLISECRNKLRLLSHELRGPTN